MVEATPTGWRALAVTTGALLPPLVTAWMNLPMMPGLDALGEKLVGDRNGDCEHRHPSPGPRGGVRGGDRATRAARTAGTSGRACSA